MPHASGKQSDSIDTTVLHAGAIRPGVRGAVILPIFQSANYEMSGDAEPGYIRYGNTPNHETLGRRLAALESMEAAVVTGSGMAATSAALYSHVRAGDHILAQSSLYGGTFNILTQHLPAMGVETTFIDVEAPHTWKAALRTNTKVLWCETITNPLVQVPPLDALATFAKEHGLVSMIDNTFASPINFNPVTMGYDLVMHSASKYLNGHSDIVAGALVSSHAIIERCARTLRALGGALDPHACFLLERGMKTLHVRVRHQCQSALTIATALARNPAVTKVNYPGLPQSQGHQRAAKWFKAFGGMLSFEVAGGTVAADRFLSRLRLPVNAGSLGGAESLVVRPATASHRSVPKHEREAMGISDGLIRMSVGLEGVDDLIDDLSQALSHS